MLYIFVIITSYSTNLERNYNRLSTAVISHTRLIESRTFITTLDGDRGSSLLILNICPETFDYLPWTLDTLEVPLHQRHPRWSEKNVKNVFDAEYVLSDKIPRPVR